MRKVIAWILVSLMLFHVGQDVVIPEQTSIKKARGNYSDER